MNDQPRSAAILGKKPEQDEAEVGVDRLRTWRVLQGQRADFVLELPPGERRRVDQTRGESGGMFQQIPAWEGLAT